MALDERTILKYMFNTDTPGTYDWMIGLWVTGWTGNNSATLPTYEVANSRQSLGTAMTWNTGTSSYNLSADMYWGPLAALSVAGWFIAKGANNDTAYVGTFTTPVATTAGDYLKLPAGYVGLGLV
jgi:hypothetical protein